MSYRLRRELIDLVCRRVKRRVPVLVGITDTSLVEAHGLACHAADAGAAAVVAAPPYYFAPGQPELVNFIEQLVRDLPLPLYLYNIPQMTKGQLAPETLRQVSHLEKIIGLKDSSGDLNYFSQLLDLKRERPDWSVLVGPEHLMAETVRLGGDGGVNGSAIFWPQLFVALFEAGTSGDEKKTESLQKKLLTLRQIYSVGQHASAVIKAMKCACSLLGLCSDRMAEPFEAFHSPQRMQVCRVLESVGLNLRNP